MTAGIAEMLLQSHAGEIHLLHALPAYWPSESVTGLKARGNVEVDVTWDEGRLVEARLRAAKDREVEVRFQGGDETKVVSLKANEEYRRGYGIMLRDCRISRISRLRF